MAECAISPLDAERLNQFEREERTRRSHWSAAAWDQVRERSLPSLIPALDQEAEQNARAVLLTGYLTLVAEAIGLQVLFPHPSQQFPNIFSAVLEHVIPNRLGTVASSNEKAKVMSELWNLCDAVANEPAWVEAALIESLLSLKSLENFSGQCAALQRELTAPAPQRLTAETEADSLKYTAVSIWPLGFFLPETVVHSGPNVFLIHGRSPGIERSFYLLAGKKPRVLTVSGRPEFAPVEVKHPEHWPEKLVRRSATHELPLRSYALAESGIAAVFFGSQKLHLWRADS